MPALAEDVHALSALAPQFVLLAGGDGLDVVFDLVDSPPEVPLLLQGVGVEEADEAEYSCDSEAAD